MSLLWLYQPMHTCLWSYINVLLIYLSSLSLCPPVPLLEHLCSALLYPDETLKASVLYVWIKLFGTAGGLAAQSLPTAIRDRVCILLLQTLADASSPQLINNCIGEKISVSLIPLLVGTKPECLLSCFSGENASKYSSLN